MTEWPDPTRFVVDALGPDARDVVEVGCGDGTLAHRLRTAGHRVVAIDPVAPDEPGFICDRFETWDPPAPVHAVVAVMVLHHADDLGGWLDRWCGWLRPGGLVIVADYGWDLDAGASDAWAAEHADLHRFAPMRAALDARLAQVRFERLDGPGESAAVPLAFRYVGRVPAGAAAPSATG